MKVDAYNKLMEAQADRRSFLKGAATATAVGALSSTGMLGSASTAYAADDLRAAILKIPGVGKGSPRDADWQKVGEMCLGATKAASRKASSRASSFSFMGLNNQNLHNLLFRGFLKPWEAYTGAKINWIDLAQADYNPRLQQAIATGTVDFDIDRDGRALGRRRLRQGPRLGDARLGQEADRYRRSRRLPEAAGRHLERQAVPHLHRRRLPQLQLPHRRVRRRRPRQGLEGGGQQGRLGRAQDLAAGAGRHQVPQGQEARRQGSLRLSRPAEGLGRLRASTSWAAALRPTPSIPTTRPGCSIPTP